MYNPLKFKNSSEQGHIAAMRRNEGRMDRTLKLNRKDRENFEEKQCCLKTPGQINIPGTIVQSVMDLLASFVSKTKYLYRILDSSLHFLLFSISRFLLVANSKYFFKVVHYTCYDSF